MTIESMFSVRSTEYGVARTRRNRRLKSRTEYLGRLVLFDGLTSGLCIDEEESDGGGAEG
jgi:hypothetical protein